MKHRRAIVISALAILVLLVLGLSVLFAAGPTPRYDVNNSGMIEVDEAHDALKAYFDGDLTQEQALDVLFHYWAAQPVDQPSPAASSQSTPTVTPIPTVTPTVTPVPSLAPTMTVVRLTPDGIQVNWEHRSQDVTGYELRYRPEGGAWATQSGSKNVSGISFGSGSLINPVTFAAGVRYEIQVRSLTKNGASPWASETRMVYAYTPSPTPAPPTPTPMPTPYPSSSGDVGCDGKDLLWGYVEAEKRYRRVNPVSDVMVVSYFHNTYTPPPGLGPRAYPEGPVLTPTPANKPWHTPTPLSFNYGFRVRKVSEWPDSVGLVIRATQNGDWFLELKGCEGQWPGPLSCPFTRKQGENVLHGPTHTFRVLDGGSFSEDGVEFDIDEGGSNHMAFIAKGEDYRFIVNGGEVPIELDAADRAAIEKYVSQFRYVSDGNWHGSYGSFGSADIAVWGRDTTGGGSYRVGPPPMTACVP